jgi:hypothetical protein
MMFRFSGLTSFGGHGFLNGSKRETYTPFVSSIARAVRPWAITFSAANPLAANSYIPLSPRAKTSSTTRTRRAQTFWIASIAS